MAITTTYAGIEYRSRLEARWAAFMQNIGWDIVYEPFDGDGYIPDFLAQGQEPLLIEVKPATTDSEYRAPVEKLEGGLAHHWKHDVLVVGASHIRRLPVPYLAHVGALGEYSPWFADDNGGGFYPKSQWDELRVGYANKKYEEIPEWQWSLGTWMACRTCDSIGVRSDDYGWHLRPCGHGHDVSRYASVKLLNHHWADACNDVKWRGRTA